MHEGSDLVGTVVADDVAHLRRQILGGEDVRPHRVLEVVADVGDAVGPGDDLPFGGGGRRAAPGVIAHAVEGLEAEVQRRQRHVGAVDGVVVAGPREVRREGLLGGVAGGAVATVVGERDRLDQREAQVRDPGDAHGDLGDLDGVGETGAQVVVFRCDEHLALARQPAPRPRVLDAVEVALEAQPVRVGILADPAVPGADRTRRPRRQGGGECGLALLAPGKPAAHERVGVAMGALYGDALLDDHRFHGPRVPGPV